MFELLITSNQNIIILTAIIEKLLKWVISDSFLPNHYLKIQYVKCWTRKWINYDHLIWITVVQFNYANPAGKIQSSMVLNHS